MEELVKVIEKLKRRYGKFKGKNISEDDTREKFVSPLLEALGWNVDLREAGYLLPDNTKADYLLKDDPDSEKGLVIVEVKKLDRQIGTKADLQAIAYAVKAHVDWYLLTNGYRWVLYRTHPNRVVFDTNIQEDDFRSSISLLGFESVTSEKLKEYWQRLVAREELIKVLMSESVLKKVSREADVPLVLVRQVAEEMKERLETGEGGPSDDSLPSDLGALQMEFWKQLLDKAKSRGLMLHARRKAARRGWIGAGAGISRMWFVYVIWQDKAGVELYIGSSDKRKNKKIFDFFYSNKARIEEDFGGPLQWQRLDDKKASRIRFEIRGGGLKDRDKWDRIQNAMIDAMERLYEALKPHIQALKNKRR